MELLPELGEVAVGPRVDHRVEDPRPEEEGAQGEAEVAEHFGAEVPGLDEEGEVGEVAEGEEEVESVLPRRVLRPLQPGLLPGLVGPRGNNIEDEGSY